MIGPQLCPKCGKDSLIRLNRPKFREANPNRDSDYEWKGEYSCLSCGHVLTPASKWVAKSGATTTPYASKVSFRQNGTEVAHVSNDGKVFVDPAGVALEDLRALLDIAASAPAKSAAPPPAAGMDTEWFRSPPCADDCKWPNAPHVTLCPRRYSEAWVAEVNKHREAIARFVNAQGRHMPDAWKQFFIDELGFQVDTGNPYQPLIP